MCNHFSEQCYLTFKGLQIPCIVRYWKILKNVFDILKYINVTKNKCTFVHYIKGKTIPVQVY
jgi:hypothetical protein